MATYYEDVRIKPGDTISGLAAEYCYKAADWEKIWKDPKNLGVVSMRKDLANVRPGDLLYISIPWKLVTKTITRKADGATLVPTIDGVRVATRQEGSVSRTNDSGY